MSTMILSPLAIAGIRLYQRHISPHKGFRCAYGAESGLKSCSAFGHHVFARYDVATASALLKRRFAACRAAFFRLGKKKPPNVPARRQSHASDCAGELACLACTP